MVSVYRAYPVLRVLQLAARDSRNRCTAVAAPALRGASYFEAGGVVVMAKVAGDVQELSGSPASRAPGWCSAGRQSQHLAGRGVRWDA